jgi:hypothetical protein
VAPEGRATRAAQCVSFDPLKLVLRATLILPRSMALRSPRAVDMGACFGGFMCLCGPGAESEIGSSLPGKDACRIEIARGRRSRMGAPDKTLAPERINL